VALVDVLQDTLGAVLKHLKVTSGFAPPIRIPWIDPVVK
jgi:hypothetical protein